jgi:hypothetical protein
MLVLADPETGQASIGIREKGLSAVETLLFAKYQMYRNVYWHHAVRSATCMFKRAVRDAVRLGVVTPERVAGLTDDAFMQVLVDEGRGTLAAAVRERRLYKRALDVPASEVPEAAAWVSDDPVLLEQVEDRLALEAGLAPGELLLDFPSRPSMLSVDLPLRLRDGRVERLTEAGRAGQLGLPRIADELYRTARRLRVFTARPPARDLAGAVRVVGMPADVVSRAGPLL